MNKDMQILAKAILELAEKSATTWDYDGEQMVTLGVILDDDIDVRRIADRGTADLDALLDEETPHD